MAIGDSSRITVTHQMTLKATYNIFKLCFYNYISIYSFYKLFTSYGDTIILNDAYINPIILYFSIDLLKNIYEKKILFCFHHVVGLFLVIYRPLELNVFYSQLIPISLSTEVSSIFMTLMHLNFKTKLIKISFLITFLYRFLLLYKVKMLLLIEKNVFMTHEYVNLYNIISTLHVLFVILHIYWITLIIKSITNKKIN